MTPAARYHIRHRIFVCLRQLTLLFGILAAIKAPWFFLLALPLRTELAFEADRDDLLARRAYIIAKVGAPDFSPMFMPSIIGQTFQEEWAIGTLSMSTIALTNLAFDFPETRQESLQVINKLIKRMLQPDIRIFENRYWGEDALETLNGLNGHIGYLGHLNLMLGAYRVLGGPCEYDSLRQQITATLVRRMRRSPSHYLETFPGQIYIPDNMVVAASISISDQVSGEDHSADLGDWVDFTRTALIDPQTQLIVPWTDNLGSRLGIPRGSYAGWNSLFLPFVDAAFAREQFLAMKAHFLVQPQSSFAALREYPHGLSGPADIDSGPVLFGLSTSGSGFALAGARHEGDASMYYGLLRTAELAGHSWEMSGKRRYLLAPLIGDSIVLAMRTSRVWDKRFLSGDLTSSPADHCQELAPAR